MWMIFFCLFAGFLIGWVNLLPQRVLAFTGQGMTAGVVFLLFTMGLRLGVDQTILSQLGQYGLHALLYSSLSVLMSLVGVYMLEKIINKRSSSEKQYLLEADPSQSTEEQFNGSQSAHPYRMTVLILGAVLVGMFTGYAFFPGSAQNMIPLATSAALDFTLFVVGMDLGQNRTVWNQMFRMGWRVFLAPFGIMIGSILAGSLVGVLLGYSWREGAAVCAGFGWYSLSGVLISNLHSVSLGTTAFLSNIFREILSILLAPLLARKASPLLLVAPGGATTMDSTLPLLVSVGPKGMGVIAFVSGFTLTSLVPFLVPLLLGKL
ncbi:lysine exporter LysO family protein [Desulfitobacterium sp. AusDCA]